MSADATALPKVYICGSLGVLCFVSLFAVTQIQKCHLFGELNLQSLRVAVPFLSLRSCALHEQSGSAPHW